MGLFSRSVFIVAILGSAFGVASGQDVTTATNVTRDSNTGLASATVTRGEETVTSAAKRYFDLFQGASSSDLVQRALTSNAKLSATRLDIERGRARLQQAGLRPNPTSDFEQA